MSRTYIILYGGRIDKRSGELDQNTKKRIKKAAQIAKQNPENFVVFCVDDTIPNLQCKTMEELRSVGIRSTILLPRAHDSLGETVVTLQFLEEQIQKGRKIILVTSSFHMHRVRFLWWWLSGQKPMFESAAVVERKIQCIIWEVLAWIKLCVYTMPKMYLGLLFN